MNQMTSEERTELKKEVEPVIKAAIGWALTRDFDTLYNIIAPDEDFYIFNPDNESTIIGFDAFKNFAESSWRRPDFHGTRFETHDLRINLSEYGTTAWYSCFLDDFIEVGGKESGWEKVRWTGVVDKRAGKWVHTQMHFSFPVE
ncbi:MAG: nuclear transport factor 2 family protein [Anaerolineales bacterium]|nr:nuclear transport factor 2 family protein [Anaerolineales bacterium]